MEARWFRNARAWRWIWPRFVPWRALLNLTWEIAQLPLYTLWEDSSPGFIAYAAHCTVGDVMIGTSALLIALTACQAGPPETWPRRRVALLAVVLAVMYTAFSDWLNTTVIRGWEYSALMPVLALGSVRIGLAPLLQWVLLPPIALRLASRPGHAG